MGFLALQILALGMTCTALRNGKSPISFATRKHSVDVVSKGINVDAGVILFSVFTCKSATVLFSTKKDTVLPVPEYKLVINDKIGSTGWKTVLYRMDENTNVQQRVMVIQQTENLCDNSHWFFVTYTNDSIAVGDYCNKEKNTFLLNDHNFKAHITTASVHGEGTAKWVFARDRRVKCKTASGKQFKDFFQLQSVSQKQTVHFNTWSLSSNLFDFTLFKKLRVTLKSCQEAYILFSSNEKFRDYFILALNKKDEIRYTREILLLKHVNAQNIMIGSSLKSENFCQEAKTLQIYWSKNHIGIGLHCDPSSGREWKIDSQNELLFVAVTIKGNESTTWNVSTTSCDVKYNEDYDKNVQHPGKDSPENLQVSAKPKSRTTRSPQESPSSTCPHHTLPRTQSPLNSQNMLLGETTSPLRSASGRRVGGSQRSRGVPVELAMTIFKVLMLSFLLT